jgi:transcriptional antiterminator RfaH
MPLLELEPFIHPEYLLDQSECLLDQSGEVEVGSVRWWVLHTRPRAEKTLARRFHDRGIPYFLPLHRREWRSNGRLLRSYLPLFAGYVFLYGDEQSRLTAFDTKLVAQVLPVEDQARLHADLRRIHQLITTGAPITPEDRLGPGDAVEVVKGPFAGLAGKVIRRGKQLRFVVDVQFLRRAVSVELESWMIQPAAAID